MPINRQIRAEWFTIIQTSVSLTHTNTPTREFDLKIHYLKFRKRRMSNVVHFTTRSTCVRLLKFSKLTEIIYLSNEYISSLVSEVEAEYVFCELRSKFLN